jgi:ribosome modulation factor
MSAVLLFRPFVDLSKLGLSTGTTKAVQHASAESYQFGYRAFLLGKSEASGRNIFNRSAYVLGWREAARMYMLNTAKA